MRSVVEKFIESLNVKVTSENRAIIKQINRYEGMRAKAAESEYFDSMIAERYGLDFHKERAEFAKRERERLEGLIEELVGQLRPDERGQR
jgi:hypothetical protein